MIESVQLERRLELDIENILEFSELWPLAHAISQLGGDTDSLTAILGSSQDTAPHYIRQDGTGAPAAATSGSGPITPRSQELKAGIERLESRASMSHRATSEVGEGPRPAHRPGAEPPIGSGGAGQTGASSRTRAQKEAEQFELDLLTG